MAFDRADGFPFVSSAVQENPLRHRLKSTGPYLSCSRHHHYHHHHHHRHHHQYRRHHQARRYFAIFQGPETMEWPARFGRVTRFVGSDHRCLDERLTGHLSPFAINRASSQGHKASRRHDEWTRRRFEKHVEGEFECSTKLRTFFFVSMSPPRRKFSIGGCYTTCVCVPSFTVSA